MVFGMFNFNPCFTYSPLAADMCSTSAFTSNNLKFASAFAELGARSLMYFTPTFSMGSYMPYPTAPSIFGGSSLSTGFDTAKIIDSLPSWDDYVKNGGCMNMTNPFMGSSIINPIQTGIGIGANSGAENNNGAGNAAETPEEAKTKNHVDLLMKLLRDVVVNSQALTSDEKAALQSALNNYTKETDTEKEAIKAGTKNKYDIQYKKLTDALEPIKGKLWKIVAKSDNFKIDNKPLHQLLRQTGYQSADIISSINSTKLNDLVVQVNAIAKENANAAASNEILTNIIANKELYPILEVISAWNTAYKNDSKKRHILKFIANKINTLGDDDAGKKAKTEAYNSTIKPVVNALVDKYDSSVQAGTITATDELNKAKSKLLDKVAAQKADNDLYLSFDKLYIALRKAETENIKKKVQDQYSFLSGTFFANSNLFTANAEKDMKAEKLNVTVSSGGGGGKTQSGGGKSGGENTPVVKTEAQKLQERKDKYNLKGQKCADGKTDRATNAQIIGENLIADIAGATNKTDGKKFEETITNPYKVNATNILYVLKGFEDHLNLGNDSFFEQLMNENQENFDLPLERLAQRVLGYVIENLEKRKGLYNENDDWYKQISDDIVKLNGYTTIDKDNCDEIDEIIKKYVENPGVDQSTEETKAQASKGSAEVYVNGVKRVYHYG